MWIILRIFFGALMYMALKEAKANAALDPMYGDLTNAFWVAVVVFLGMANGVVWAPYFAEKVADPLTGGLVESEYKDEKRWMILFIRMCANRNMRGLTRGLCFLEGCRTPWLPTAFNIGLANSEEGSWFEKIFATEVFKFNNAQNCLTAYRALKRHGIDPRPHHSPGVNLLIISNEHEVKERPEDLPVPPAPEPPKLQRNKRIELGMD